MLNGEFAGKSVNRANSRTWQAEPVEIAQVLDAALRKAAAVWVAVPGRPPRLVWALWRQNTIWLAVGGTEQEVPGLADGVECVVTVRSPSTHSHLLETPAVARLVDPDEETALALRTARLNTQPEWESVYRLEIA